MSGGDRLKRHCLRSQIAGVKELLVDEIRPFVVVQSGPHLKTVALASEGDGRGGEGCLRDKSLSIFNTVLLTFERTKARAGAVRGI
jgi:hypothetical protein